MKLQMSKLNKKNLGVLLAIICSLVLLQLAPKVEAADASPTIYDKTYIDALEAELTTVDDNLMKQLADTQSKLDDAQTKLTDTQTKLADTQTKLAETQAELADVKDSMVFKIYKLPAGKTLIGGASTEIIVRNKDRVTAYVSSTATGGVSNLISGKDMKNGEIVPDNQLLLIPKGDGRGITAKKDADIMIKGSYTIK